MAHQKLELTWIGKDQRPRLEPRILLEDPARSYHARQRVTDKDIFDNRLIKGDNLLALKALEAEFAGKVKCVFIDPPYNTGSAFTHYDDGLEHSIWLGLMRDRLEIIRRLLAEDGSLWITIDDNEAHYLKVLCDEVFGRSNFVATFAWEKDKGRRNDTDISSAHDHVLLYAKSREVWRKIRNPLPRTEEQKSRYRNPDNDPRGPWLQGDNGTAKSGSESARFPITLPSGRVVVPPTGNFWRFSIANFEKARAEGRVYFGAKGDGLPIIKRYLTEVQDGVVPRTWWPAEEAGSNQSAKRDHLRKLLPEIEPFATPKPEELLKLALQISTNPGDLVLDSFAGSGTTGAVAHKMGRRWIGIEMGDHAVTHCLPRLQKVIAGEQGGISQAVGWQGGGGMRFMTLGAPIFDAQGRIHPEVRFATLAAFVWQQETGTAFDPVLARAGTPLLGVHSVFDSYLRPLDGREVAISPSKEAPALPPDLFAPDDDAAAADLAIPPVPAEVLAELPAPVLLQRTAYYLLFNGILGDKRPASGNVLTSAVLDALLALHASTPHPDAPLVVYGEACRLGEARLALARVVFKHIPYDVRAR